MSLRIERYVLARVLAAVMVCLVIIAAVEIMVGFVAISRDVGGRIDITPAQVLGLTLMQAPSVLMILAPFVFLFGTLAAYVTLNRRSELVAMRAAGAMNRQADSPAARMATSSLRRFRVT